MIVKVKVLDQVKGIHLRKNFTVADHSAAIVFSAWEAVIDKLQVGLSYKISATTVKVYQAVKFLNSNKETVIETIDDIGPLVQISQCLPP